MQSKILSYTESFLTYIFLFSIFLLPGFKLYESTYTIQISDLLIPFFSGYILLNIKRFDFNILKQFLLPILLLLVIVFISIIINHRIYVLQDDFELLKLIKFLIVFIFFATCNYNRTHYLVLKVIFTLVLIFNFLHYINFEGFNQNIMIYYSNEIQLSSFGINSLGHQDTIRLLGTLGNPNNNAILFLFFFILFFPRKESKILDNLFFIAAGIGVIACQSRTGFISLVTIFIIGSIISKPDNKLILVMAGIYLLSFIGFNYMGNKYLNTLASNVTKQTSVTGRINVWEMLWNMIKEKPYFGYSPFKEYFYSHKIYSENEYILYLWRYGFIGLGAYIFMLLNNIYIAYRSVNKVEGYRLLLFTIVIIITAITNNPLSDVSVFMMYSFLAGNFFSMKLSDTTDK